MNLPRARGTRRPPASRQPRRAWRLILGSLLVAQVSCGTPAGDAVEEASAPPARTAIFREVADASGLVFRHFTGGTGRLLIPEIIGAGVALIDYDADGDLDVYLLQGTVLDPATTPAEATFPPPRDHWPGNRLYRNDLVPGGALGFTDVTQRSGVGHESYGMGAAVGDYDGDGFADLYVTNLGSNVLYRNAGDGTFIDVTRDTRTDDERWSTSAAFADYDQDGDLDLFITNYIAFTVESHETCQDATGAPDFCNPSQYPPLPDRLLRNDGDGRFTDVTATAGLDAAYGSGLGVTWADLDGDGWPDVYVANDGDANQLWRNQGDGTLTDLALMSGTAYNVDGVAEAGMGVTAGDVDGDGDEDLFMSHLAHETNTLYLNDGRGDFRDVTSEFGLSQPSFRSTGFGTEWFDYDNDGTLDLFVANGAVTSIETLRGEPYPFHQPNQLFHNDATGMFREITGETEPALAPSEVSRGAAFGDLDNDGDVDIVVTNNNGPARLLLNELGAEANWIGVRLRGDTANREGIGARVGLLLADHPVPWRRVHRDGSYLSSNDPRVYFGLGSQTSVDGVVVRWGTDDTEVWNDVRVGTVVTLRQGTGRPWAPGPATTAAGR